MGQIHIQDRIWYFGEQNMAYKVLKKLIWTNKDTVEINNIEDQKWIQHYKKNMVYEFPAKRQWWTRKNLDPAGRNRLNLRRITWTEPEINKNRKAAGPDGLNSELFKYGGTRPLRPLT